MVVARIDTVCYGNQKYYEIKTKISILCTPVPHASLSVRWIAYHRLFRPVFLAAAQQEHRYVIVLLCCRSTCKEIWGSCGQTINPGRTFPLVSRFQNEVRRMTGCKLVAYDVGFW
jgi:hypothetical protein